MKTKNFNRIKAVIAEKGISNIQLAHGIGVNPSTVSTWCTNRKQPAYETLLKIAEFLNVEMGDLLSKRKDIREIEFKDI